jgi:hypothetical protein
MLSVVFQGWVSVGSMEKSSGFCVHLEEGKNEAQRIPLYKTKSEENA